MNVWRRDKVSTKRMRIIITSVLAIIIAVQVRCEESDSPVTQDQISDYLGAVSNLFVGSIRVAGRVVDDQGDMLSDVAITLEITYVDHRDETNTVLSSDFQFAWSNCSSVIMRFKKDGYSVAKRECSVTNDSWPPTGSGGSFTDTNLVIVLQHFADAVDLDVCEGFIYFNEGALPEWCLLDFSSGSACMTTKSSGSEMTDLRAGIYLSCNTNENGTIVVDDKGGVDVLLRAVNGNGGFVVDDGNGTVASLVNMTSAPQEGYSETIQVLVNGEDRFFFFRIGDFYGKGCIGPALLDALPTGRRIKAYIGVAVQSDGSRNLLSPLEF
jgi:hypothetical protein